MPDYHDPFTLIEAKLADESPRHLYTESNNRQHILRVPVSVLGSYNMFYLIANHTCTPRCKSLHDMMRTSMAVAPIRYHEHRCFTPWLQVLFNSIPQVLFTFQLLYLYAIGLVIVLRLTRDSPRLFRLQYQATLLFDTRGHGASLLYTERIRL